jgi:hypothetical protein
MPANPRIIIAHVEGSGTAGVDDAWMDTSSKKFGWPGLWKLAVFPKKLTPISAVSVKPHH